MSESYVFGSDFLFTGMRWSLYEFRSIALRPVLNVLPRKEGTGTSMTSGRTLGNLEVITLKADLDAGY